MKKLTALLLALALLTGAVSAAFTDADKITDDFADAVAYMSEKGIITGFPDGSFRPKETLTRAQAAKILCTVLEGADKVESITATASFTDVPAGHWAEKFVGYCADKGIVSGVGNNKFNPNGQLTNAAFAKMLLVAFGADGAKFTGSEWVISVQKALREASMNYKVGASGDPMQREQACQMAYNFMRTEELKNVEGYSQTTVKPTAQNVKLLGRAEAAADGVTLNFPSDGIEFTVDCKGEIRLQYAAQAAHYATAFVDGVETNARVRLNMGSGETALLYRFVAPGEHTIRIVQDSEVSTSGGRITIQSVTLEAKSEPKPTAKKDLYIEYVGASMIAGCGTLGTTRDTWSAAFHAATKSFAYFTAEKLNADYSMIAKGGIGYTKPSGTVTVEDMYVYQNAWLSKTVRHDDSRKPDVVVFAVGANDKQEDPDTAFRNGLLSCVKLVRQEVGDKAKIVLIYGMMGVRHEAAQTGVCEELGGAAKGYYVFKMPTLTNGVPATAGGTPHPSAEDNMKSSTQLAEFIKTIL